ncbi:macro domain-containing protein [Neisseria chenwenguii]|uniref:Phosphatase n=1 Tax=Neisseria chenwenguii TaxID=1853278 RepID=A0A220S1D2_9NEIS|nr:macro domain-containing protein [Neisseria chenwenguii]ASK27291.1 phosphatase [Neisseria chenwenguii]ROV57034.1 phosphatase [Neisseria chenwenguii]
MQTIKGDLIALAEAGGFDVIVHGCNCRHAMDAGIAKQIKAHFPEAYAADCATPESAGKLGQISVAEIGRDRLKLFVVNAYTQDNWQGSGVLADYAAICSAMRQVKQRFSGLRIGYPKIGAGLARGDWSVIAAIIDEELAGETHTLVEYAR